jgi:predicted nucleic acid-binding Zn ribbon protein
MIYKIKESIIMPSKISKKCKGCSRIFHPTKKYSNSDLCSVCRKYHKECKVCGKEIFVQAVTCSKECAYELKKKTWLKSCGTIHNFSKNSKSRKKFEKKLMEEEGIINPAQRNEVKEKIKETFRKKYNGIDNPFGVKTIRDQIRKNKEEQGVWIPLDELSDCQKYRLNVDSISRKNFELYGEKYLSITPKNKKILNKNKEFRNKLSIDHKYSVYSGFKNKIDPEIIGSIVNMEIIPVYENSGKNKRNSISLAKLVEKYIKFSDDENKICQKNKI